MLQLLFVEMCVYFARTMFGFTSTCLGLKSGLFIDDHLVLPRVAIVQWKGISRRSLRF